jgi:hypothetical protein
VEPEPGDIPEPWNRPTAQVLALSNHVAVALKRNQQNRDKMVGMYAYFITSLTLMDNYPKKWAKNRFYITAEEFNNWKRSKPFTYTEMLILLEENLKRPPD